MPNRSGELTYRELPDATLEPLYAALDPGGGYASNCDVLAESTVVERANLHGGSRY